MGDVEHDPLAQSSTELKPCVGLLGRRRQPRCPTGISVEALKDGQDVIRRLNCRRVVESLQHTVKVALSEDGASSQDQDKDGSQCHDNVQRPFSSCRSVNRSSSRFWS